MFLENVFQNEDLGVLREENLRRRQIHRLLVLGDDCLYRMLVFFWAVWGLVECYLRGSGVSWCRLLVGGCLVLDRTGMHRCLWMTVWQGQKQMRCVGRGVSAIEVLRFVVVG